MRRTTTILVFALTLSVAAACQQEQQTTTAEQPQVAPAANLTPEQLGELGARIQKEPDRAEEILQQHGLTPESYEQAVRGITEDVDASRRYSDALRKAAA